MANDDKFEIALVGAEQITKRLTAAVAALEDPYELLDAIGAELETNILLRFHLKQDGAGNAWPPLAESTRERYAHTYGDSIPGSLLERTRHMRASLAHNTTKDGVEVGFSAAYAIYHVTGTRKMPRRDPIFGVVSDDGTQGELGQRDQADILELIDEFMADALGA